MKVIKTKDEMIAVALALKGPGRTTGFVPTMGYLHEGHVSLLRKSKQDCTSTILSIFVNPIQFGPNEDFDRYPREPDRDLEIALKEGVDFVFMPETGEMYRKDHLSFVNVEKLDSVMCGSFRENHFRGVCTVVIKLFNIMNPDYAFFGEKDFQQLAIIKKMAKDLDLPVKIVGCRTVREQDGLAMSSRNRYLSVDERENAPLLHNTILYAGGEIKKGCRNLSEIKTKCIEMLTSNPYVKKVDYFDFRDPETLEEQEYAVMGQGDILIAAAIYMGTTRLIDNETVGLRL